MCHVTSVNSVRLLCMFMCEVDMWPTESIGSMHVFGRGDMGFCDPLRALQCVCVLGPLRALNCNIVGQWLAC